MPFTSAGGAVTISFSVSPSVDVPPLGRIHSVEPAPSEASESMVSVAASPLPFSHLSSLKPKPYVTAPNEAAPDAPAASDGAQRRTPPRRAVVPPVASNRPLVAETIASPPLNATVPKLANGVFTVRKPGPLMVSVFAPVPLTVAFTRA